MHRIIAIILILIFSWQALPLRQWMGVNDVPLYSLSEEDKADKAKQKEKKADKDLFCQHSFPVLSEIAVKASQNTATSFLPAPYFKTLTPPPDGIDC